MSITVRRATSADLDTVTAVAAETFGLACPPGTTDEAIRDFITLRLNRDVFAGHVTSDDRILVLAEDGGQVIGYSLVIGTPPADPDVAAVVTARPAVEVSKFYTVARVHGGGVAAPLMAGALEAARELAGRQAVGASGVETGSGPLDHGVVWLGVNQQNARPIRFYEKSGFVVVGTKTFALGGRLEEDFVMAQPLSSASPSKPATGGTRSEALGASAS